MGGGIKSIFSRPDERSTAAGGPSPDLAAVPRAPSASGVTLAPVPASAPAAKKKRKAAKKNPPASDSTRTAPSTMPAVDEQNPAQGADAKKGAAGGYHYFHEMANRGTAPKAQPVKLSDEEAALARKLEGSGGSGLSSWNKAGTWEERGHTAWAKSRVESLVVGHRVAVPGGGAAVIKSVKTFNGDATVVMVRGKPRHGFDFDITLTWECSFEDDEEGVDPVRGTVHVPEASRDTVEDDEVEYAVAVENRKTERRAKEDAAYGALKKGLREFLRESFATLDRELLARAEGS